MGDVFAAIGNFKRIYASIGVLILKAEQVWITLIKLCWNLKGMLLTKSE